MQIKKFFSDVYMITAGIYVMYNSFHKYFYVGITLNMANRFGQHKNDLDANRHKNSLLQIHYNEILALGKHPNDFIFLEPVYFFLIKYAMAADLEKKIKTELRFKEFEIAKELSNTKYNIYNNLEVQVKEKNSFFSKKHTSDTKKKMSKAHSAKQVTRRSFNQKARRKASKANSVSVNIHKWMYLFKYD